MKQDEQSRENAELANPSTQQPDVEEMASGNAERAILGDQGPWGFLGLVTAIALFIVIAGIGFFFANS